MEQTIVAYGRAIIVAGIVPVLLFTVLILALLLALGVIVPIVGPEEKVTLQELLLLLLICAGVGGVLLTALNKPLIHFYEGAFSFQRRWLLKGALRRNLDRHEALYQTLLPHREMYDEATTALRAEDGSQPSDKRRRVNSAALAIDDAYDLLEVSGYDNHLPIDPLVVAPTALGNAYAVMEEYPYHRYGIDPMVLWPRLLAVLPSDYRASIGEQKTTCDFLLNLSLLLTLFAVATWVIFVARAVNNLLFPSVALAGFVAGFIAYGLYRAAVAETIVLGKLINGAFDLYRGRLLEQFGFRRPSELVEEKALWRELAVFISRGEPFYYPHVEDTPESDMVTPKAKREVD